MAVKIINPGVHVHKIIGIHDSVAQIQRIKDRHVGHVHETRIENRDPHPLPSEIPIMQIIPFVQSYLTPGETVDRGYSVGNSGLHCRHR